MTRTDESLGGAVNFARMSSAEARFSRAKTAFMISRSRRVRRSVAGFGIRDMCRILDATHVACQLRSQGARQMRSAMSQQRVRRSVIHAREGVSIRAIQEALGHKSVAMTVRYSHL